MTWIGVSTVAACIAAAVATADSTKNRSAAPEAAPTADPIHSLRLDPDDRRLPLRAAPPQRRAPDAPPLLTRGGAVDLLDAADQYDFFDGFETYELGPLEGQSMNAPPGLIGVNGRPSMVIANTLAEGLPPGRDPFGTGDFQILKDARGDTGDLDGFSRRWQLDLDRLYYVTPEQDVIVCMDVYFPDLETLHTFEPASYTEGLIAARVMQAGHWQASNFTATTGGVLTRPAVLGPPSFGVVNQFYAPPLDTGTDGELAPFTTRTGEWFTVAVRLSTQGTSVWIRDGQTDGANGVLIEDPDPAPFLESGWFRLYPGRVAQQTAPAVWTGYGVAVNEFGQPADQPEHFLGARTVEAVLSNWFSSAGTPDDPEWAPTNRYMDNVCIIGPSWVLSAPIPRQRLPYKDDFELYQTGVPPFLSLLHVWTATNSDVGVASGEFDSAPVNTTPPHGSDGSGAPDRSLFHHNLGIDAGQTQRIAWTLTPVRDQRPWVAVDDPVRIDANFRLTGDVTRYGLQIVDNDVDGVEEALNFGADADLRFHIRRQNPAFDPLATPSDDGHFGAPFGSANPPLINYPTTTSVTFGASFFNAELTLHGDSTASWSVNGALLEIDPDFAASDPDILEELQVARLIQTGGATDAPPYTHFLTDMRTFDTVELWSNIHPDGLDEHLFIDDLCIDGPARVIGPGPMFELPYTDDFSLYSLDQPVAGQGETLLTQPRISMGALVLINETGAGDPDPLYCRYRIQAIYPGPDPSMGGAPFDCPDGWAFDAIVAIPAFGALECPGFGRFEIRDAEDCTTCFGRWSRITDAPEDALPDDLLTHTQDRAPTPRWADLIHDGTSATSGVRGDGDIRDASAHPPVDPFGERGNVLSFVNTGLFLETGGLGRLQAHLALPEIIVEEIDTDEFIGARSAALHWDVYLQDPHTRPIFIVRGPRFNIADGSLSTNSENFVAGVRLGGPTVSNEDFDDGEIAVMIPIPGMLGVPQQFAWEGVGVTAPTGSWVRIRLDVDRAGENTITWRLGMNSSGLIGGPGGPVEFGGDGMGDRPGHFDHTLPGAHPDALRLATGAAPVLPSSTLTHPLGVNAIEFRQGFDASGAPGNPNNPGGAPSRWWVDRIHLEEIVVGAPPCPFDLTGSGVVGSSDLGFVLGCWGVVSTGPCVDADFTNSGAVGSADLAQLLGNWGPCP